MGFRLHLKWGAFPIHSPASSCPPSSYSCRGRDSSSFLPRLPASSVLYGEAEILNETYRTHAGSSYSQLLEDCFSRIREEKVPIEKGSIDGSQSLVANGIQTSYDEDELAFLTILQATGTTPRFRLLMENLDILESMCADSDMVRLERDILQQLERLGALRLFHSCLSNTVKSSDAPNSCNSSTELINGSCGQKIADDHSDKVIIQSSKKELRKLRRRKTQLKENRIPIQESCTDIISDDSRQPNSASSRISSQSGNKKHKIARNEAEMSSGIKMVVELEKIRTVLEEERGQTTSLSRWAEAAGIKKKELHQHLHYGWHCRDELLRSTRSLVLFIARNYGGLGIAFEDLIQAGNIGVLRGAERFDHSRGYKFSTYVQYWIRKSISALVAKHARGIRIPSTLSKVINQVQKARKALSASHGKYPDDSEIAKHTGLSVAKIASARKCLRVVGSIDQTIWDDINIKYTEIMPDTSIASPEEAVTRMHMIKDIYRLLNGLEPRERQVLVLRFGIGNQQCKSLEEIGRQYRVSKEWIRKIERRALAKLRDENTVRVLSHYARLQL